MERFGLTQDLVAQKVGKSRPAVANSLRLLGLNETEQDCLIKGRITQGHARALLAISDKELREKALEMILRGATVREIEAMRQPKNAIRIIKPRKKVYSEVELSLKRALGRKVDITTNKNGGVLHIEFYSEEELYDFARRLADDK